MEQNVLYATGKDKEYEEVKKVWRFIKKIYNCIEDNHTKKSTIETYLHIGTKEEIVYCVIFGTIYLFLFLLPANLIWTGKEGRSPPEK